MLPKPKTTILPEEIFKPGITVASWRLFTATINRALVLTQKYFGGIVPEGAENWRIMIKKVLAEIPEIISRVEKNLDNFHFREGLKECMNLARLGNKYLADTEPWKLNQDR